jgi:hypothetical protein
VSEAPPSLARAARRLTDSLQKETRLARRGALGELAAAAEEKADAMRAFIAACSARGEMKPSSSLERDELRRVLAAAAENALTLEAVTNTLQHLAANVRTAAATAADPGTYSATGRTTRHVWAASVDASV